MDLAANRDLKNRPKLYELEMAGRSEEPENWDHRHHSNLIQGGINVADFQTADDAYFAAYLLREQGIRSAVLVPDGPLDLRYPQIKVAPDDEEVARRVLAESVPARKRKEYDSVSEVAAPEFPPCQNCGSDEIVLVGVQRGNQWRCEHCGTSWTETVTCPGN